MTRGPARGTRGAFTLVEILVSMAIIILLLLSLVTVTDSTRKIWTSTTSKIAEFQDAREAFEAVTRRVSQATLNTYLDYEYQTNSDGTPDTTQPPKRYTRQSELRFINGVASSMITAAFAANCPTHAIFFQAPLGYTDNSSHADLGKLLNTCGYYIQFGDDKNLRPDFISPQVPLKYRFRLMEMVESTEALTLYKYSNKTPGYVGTTWFNDPLALSPPPAQVRAENIVALVILPKLTPEEDPTGIKLSPLYSYDSTATNSDPAINPRHQLPPVVQVTMVAVDEASFARMQTTAAMPALYSASAFTDASKYDTDLQTMAKTLTANKLNYRVFTTNISLKASKWSRIQVN